MAGLGYTGDMVFLAFIFAGLLLGAYLWFCIETVRNMRPGRVIYLGTNLKEVAPVLQEIIKEYVPNTREVHAAEYGAGFGYVARWLARQYPWKAVSALEINLSTHLISRLWNRLCRVPVRAVRTDVLASQPPRGSLIYSYLSTEITTRLYEEGRLDGCLFVSLTFLITGVAPTKEYPLKGWQRRVLVYDLRRRG
jgi:hypothetical protein